LRYFAKRKVSLIVKNRLPLVLVNDMGRYCSLAESKKMAVFSDNQKERKEPGTRKRETWLL